MPACPRIVFLCFSGLQIVRIAPLGTAPTRVQPGRGSPPSVPRVRPNRCLEKPVAAGLQGAGRCGADTHPRAANTRGPSSRAHLRFPGPECPTAPRSVLGTALGGSPWGGRPAWVGPEAAGVLSTLPQPRSGRSGVQGCSPAKEARGARGAGGEGGV